MNFLRKVMSSSRHDGAAYSRHPCRQSADADIVSAFPLSFSTFLENINILRQTSSTWHRMLREFCVLKSFQKPVALAGYKNKQCRKQTSVLSGRIVTAYVPLRSATERERAAFLIPCQGLRDYFTNSQFTPPVLPIVHIIFLILWFPFYRQHSQLTKNVVKLLYLYNPSNHSFYHSDLLV